MTFDDQYMWYMYPINIIEKPKEYLPKEKWARYNKRRQQVIIDLDKEYGKRLELVLALGVAEEMIQYEQFYYAYQVDYHHHSY